MRVALADDGALFREGLALMLQAAGHEITHSVDDGNQLLDRLDQDVERETVDLAVLDIRMPPEPEGGLVTAARLRARRPELPILLLSHYAETHYLSRVLEIGPERTGYRLKDRISSLDTLADTVVRVTSGEFVVEPELTSRLVDHARTQSGELGALPAPELRVLRLMAGGLPDSAIAEELGLPPAVVGEHVRSLSARLGIPAGPRVPAVLRYLDGAGRSREQGR